MRELPRGTVTFLFTDIEGSTRLLDEVGAEEYGSALAQHRRVEQFVIAVGQLDPTNVELEAFGHGRRAGRGG